MKIGFGLLFENIVLFFVFYLLNKNFIVKLKMKKIMEFDKRYLRNCKKYKVMNVIYLQ